MSQVSPVRTYLVANATALFDADARIEFRSSLPAGAIHSGTYRGRPYRAELTDEPLINGRFRADLEVRYL